VSGVEPELVVRALTGDMKIAPDGLVRSDARYLTVGRDGAGRPILCRRVDLRADCAFGAKRRCRRNRSPSRNPVFRADLYDAALGGTPPPFDSEPRDGIGAFVGPKFARRRHRRVSGGLAHEAPRPPAAVAGALFLHCTVILQHASVVLQTPLPSHQLIRPLFP